MKRPTSFQIILEYRDHPGPVIIVIQLRFVSTTHAHILYTYRFQLPPRPRPVHFLCGPLFNFILCFLGAKAATTKYCSNTAITINNL